MSPCLARRQIPNPTPADRPQRASDRQDGNGEREQHEDRDHPGYVEDELLQQRMHKSIAAAGAPHPDRDWPGRAVERDAEAIVVLCTAGEARQMEVARIFGRRRPALDQRTEGARLGSDDAAKDYGCIDQFDAVTKCATDHFACSNAHISITGCDSEQKALSDCEKAASGKK